uniref:Conotoxin n=1 Tax=Globodera pallida TaxID=36090 RepID=A0A183CP63_GLOPA
MNAKLLLLLTIFLVTLTTSPSTAEEDNFIRTRRNLSSACHNECAKECARHPGFEDECWPHCMKYCTDYGTKEGLFS